MKDWPVRSITFVPVAAGLIAVAGAATARPPIYNAVTLIIGLNCQWQQRCMARQEAAMKRALDYVRVARPANWRVQQCNRNAARGRYRVDWVGFDNCIRNASLRPPPPRPLVRKRRPTA